MRSSLRRAIAISVAASAIGVLSPISAATASEGFNLETATRYTGHAAGHSVDHADVAAAMRRIGHDPGYVIDEGDEQKLIDWANRAKVAVDTALAQVGDPYQWGATGPDRFDCSGLTLYSWRAAGVELPRTSRAQADATRSVAKADLVPGDLVFYGNPIHHVAIYIGDGAVVDSPRSGYNVKVDREMLKRTDLVKFGRVL